MKKLLVTLLVALSLVSCFAEEERIVKKRWFCEENYSGSKVIAEVFENGKTGRIKFDEVEIFTDYMIDGLEREWQWGNINRNWFKSIYKYTFLIDSGNRGYYYDFAFADEKGIASSRKEYKCVSEILSGGIHKASWFSSRPVQ